MAITAYISENSDRSGFYKNLKMNEVFFNSKKLGESAMAATIK